MKALITVLLSVLALPSLGRGQTPPPAGPAETEHAIRLLEARRFEAMVRADLAALDSILSDELTYTHSSGRLESKAQFLATLGTGALRYLAIEPEEADVRVYGGGTSAVVTGRARVRVQSQGEERSFQIRYTDVYVQRQRRWQMVAWQSTRLP